MKMLKRFTPLVLVLFLSSCAATNLWKEADTPEQKYWVTLHTFNVYDEAALYLALNINTPAAVRLNLKRTRMFAKTALVLADEAYQILQGARLELDANPDVTNLDKFSAALNSFNRRAESAFGKIDSLIDLVDKIQE